MWIGRVDVAWSSVENSINWSIWAVAELAPTLGACLTSQIYTLDGRVGALLALLRFRQTPLALVSSISQFSEDARGLQEISNHIVHDTWMWRLYGAVGRLEITAPRKLHFDIIQTSIEDLKRDFQKIKSFAEQAKSKRSFSSTAVMAR